MATRITETEVQADSAAATLTRRDGSLSDNRRFVALLLVPGQVVTVDVSVDGRSKGTLTWTASARADRNAAAQVKLTVNDDADQAVLAGREAE